MTSVGLKKIFYIHLYRKQNFMFIMKMERLCSFETLATPNHSTTFHNSEYKMIIFTAVKASNYTV